MASDTHTTKSSCTWFSLPSDMESFWLLNTFSGLFKMSNLSQKKKKGSQNPSGSRNSEK